MISVESEDGTLDSDGLLEERIKLAREMTVQKSVCRSTPRLIRGPEFHSHQNGLLRVVTWDIDIERKDEMTQGCC